MNHSSETSSRPRSSRRRLFAGVSIVALALSAASIGGTTASADQKEKKPKKEKLVELQLLAFNDYHGHVEAGTPGNIDGQPAGGGE
jgi:5'-nucleotidase